MFHDIQDKVTTMVAASMAASPVWVQFLKDYNDSILVPLASVLGITYLVFKIYFLVKNKGKD